MMTVIVRIPDELAARLAAVGASPEKVALEALRNAAEGMERAQGAAKPGQHRTPPEAATRMRHARAGNVLPEGITLRDLMTLGRA